MNEMSSCNKEDGKNERSSMWKEESASEETESSMSQG